eukprot:gene9116-9285_t
MAEADEDEINLESLKVLKEIFEAADEDGSGELDIDEFCAKLGPHLGVNLRRQQVAQLFMKIDADAGGTVDWDEFTNYMFLEKVQASATEDSSDNWRLFPADFREKNESMSYHHEQVDKVYFCSAIDKYITCARDGSFRLWNAADLKHVRTVSNGSSWITDCLYLPHSRKVVFTTMDRAVTHYDINRGSYDLIGCVYASGAMGVPLALNVLSGDAGERVVYGDSNGDTVLLLCGSRELPARDLISTDNHKDYLYLHKDHNDWITKVQWVPEVGLVTSSLDTTIKTFDINRERITHTCTHHAKGVHSFVWCKAYSCFASCGLERDVMVWHGTTGRKMGELHGHISSVTHIALDEHLNHVFTLSIDKTIKVWDLRNHKCLQTISEDDWANASDSQATSMIYDNSRRRLVTAFHRPYVWQHKAITQDRTGHREPIRGALYNSLFAVVVSVDDGGATCVWNLQVMGSVMMKPAGHVVTVVLPANQRRLVTAANDGSIKMWNFNNGSLLRRFCHHLQPLEMCDVLLTQDEKRGGDNLYAAGWNAKVFMWEDEDEAVVENFKAFDGHEGDILAMAAYPDRQLLATGDCTGRVIVWGLGSGERKSTLWYSQSSHCQGINADDPSYHSAEAAEDAGRTTGSDNDDYETDEDDAVLVKHKEAPNALLLLVAGGDGLVQVWRIGQLAQATLLCSLPDEELTVVVMGDSGGHLRTFDISRGIDTSSSEAARASFVERAHWQAHEESLSSVSITPARPIAGASQSGGTTASCSAVSGSGGVEQGWASTAGVRRSAAGSTGGAKVSCCGCHSGMVPPLIVAGSRDRHVTVWTLDGGLVGTFGEHSWDLDNVMTWQDPQGLKRRPPKAVDDGLFLKVGGNSSKV